MTCSNCHTHNFRDYKYCRECGSKLEAPLPDAPASTLDAVPPAPVPPGSLESQVDALLLESLALLDQDNLDAAQERAQAALILQPASAPAHSALSLIHERQGKLQEAAEQLELALQLDPENSADRARLEGLRGKQGAGSRAARWTPAQLALASAVGAGVLVFGSGLAIILHAGSAQGSHPSRSQWANATNGIPLPAPSFAAAPPVSGVPAAGGAYPSGGVKSGVGLPVTATTGSRPVVGAPARPNPAGVNFAKPAPRPLPAATEVQRVGLPRIVDKPSTPVPAPSLGPAAIGKIVPLPQGTAGSLAPEGSAQHPAAAAPPPAAPAAGDRNPQAARVREPAEPDTGFIKIEPVGGSAPPGASAPGGVTPNTQSGTTATPPVPAHAAASRAPSISVSFAPPQAEGPTLEEGRREERLGTEAVQKKDAAGAARHFSAASRAYEAVIRRGGAEARQAGERLDAVRRQLAEGR